MMEELTQYQRLVLVNQYLILEKLYPEQAKEYEQIRLAVEGGYPTWYEDAFGYYVSDGLTKEQCQEVSDILNMFWLMQMAYERLDDKTGINKGFIEFRGFDGNNETDYLHLSEYIIDIKGRFSGLKAINSHSMVLGTYRRMLAEWKKVDISQDITKEDLIRVTEAAIHPSNR